MDNDLTSGTLLVVEEKEQGKPVVKTALGSWEKLVFLWFASGIL
jgi:hypothetical protein